MHRRTTPVETNAVQSKKYLQNLKLKTINFIKISNGSRNWWELRKIHRCTVSSLKLEKFMNVWDVIFFPDVATREHLKNVKKNGKKNTARYHQLLRNYCYTVNSASRLDGCMYVDM